MPTVHNTIKQALKAEAPCQDLHTYNGRKTTQPMPRTHSNMLARDQLHVLQITMS